MGPYLWTRHAEERIFHFRLERRQVEDWLDYGTLIPEGNNKFKIVCRVRNAQFIVVCREDEMGVWIVTVIRKRG